MPGGGAGDGAAGAVGDATRTGAGITLDEGFNVAMGVYLVRSLEADGLGSLHPATVREVYGSTNYNADHPPLGRWALGFVHELLAGNEGEIFSEYAARPAAGVAFALTVLVMGWFMQKWFGPVAGTFAALAVAVLPRQFAHAHLASLETFIGLTYAACVLVTADRCRPGTDGSRGWKAFAVAGVFFGLALLTKIQAVFLGPAVGLWALTQWRLKAIPRVALFGAVGLACFSWGGLICGSIRWGTCGSISRGRRSGRRCTAITGASGGRPGCAVAFPVGDGGGDRAGGGAAVVPVGCGAIRGSGREFGIDSGAGGTGCRGAWGGCVEG